jgi:hypothetical protein
MLSPDGPGISSRNHLPWLEGFGTTGLTHLLGEPFAF